ncbi:MAG TPA: hypothetical protein VFH47_02820 [Candidatus Thermoplasmatota archaeon]|nr:hypothetical protein [Candidatus Thermoplasmatota archaeon]
MTAGLNLEDFVVPEVLRPLRTMYRGESLVAAVGYYSRLSACQQLELWPEFMREWTPEGTAKSWQFMKAFTRVAIGLDGAPFTSIMEESAQPYLRRLEWHAWMPPYGVQLPPKGRVCVVTRETRNIELRILKKGLTNILHRNRVHDCLDSAEDAVARILDQPCDVVLPAARQYQIRDLDDDDIEALRAAIPRMAWAPIEKAMVSILVEALAQQASRLAALLRTRRGRGQTKFNDDGIATCLHVPQQGTARRTGDIHLNPKSPAVILVSKLYGGDDPWIHFILDPREAAEGRYVPLDYARALEYLRQLSVEAKTKNLARPRATRRAATGKMAQNGDPNDKINLRLGRAPSSLMNDIYVVLSLSRVLAIAQKLFGPAIDPQYRFCKTCGTRRHASEALCRAPTCGAAANSKSCTADEIWYLTALRLAERCKTIVDDEAKP